MTEKDKEHLEETNSDSKWLVAIRQVINLYEGKFKKLENSVKYAKNFVLFILKLKKDER